jgi:hypothetical protein
MDTPFAYLVGRATNGEMGRFFRAVICAFGAPLAAALAFDCIDVAR